MNYWVCKGRAENEFKSLLRPGRVAEWHTARPPKKLSRGDLVFLWESTPHRRVVGLARVHNPDSGRNRDGHRLFKQKYLTRRFPSPLGMEELRRIPILNTAAFLKAGPNVLLTALNSEQAEILLDLLHLRNPSEVPRALWPDSTKYTALPSVADVIALTFKEGGRKLFIHYAREKSQVSSR